MIGADGAKKHAGHGNATEASILVLPHCTLSINVPEYPLVKPNTLTENLLGKASLLHNLIDCTEKDSQRSRSRMIVKLC